MTNTLYFRLLEEIQKIKIVSTHEHIMSRDEVRQEPLHLFRVFENSYARLDFITAGMPPEAWQKSDPQEVWEVFRKYQAQASLTCFTRNIIRALQDLYGLEEDCITEENWPELSEKVRQAYDREDWYHYVLTERANFEVAFLDTFWSVEKFTFDPELFLPVLRTNPLILGRGFVSRYPRGKVVHTTVEKLAGTWGVELDEFQDYLGLVEMAISRYKDAGAPAVKIAVAYERSLVFDRVSRDEAARLYGKGPGALTAEEEKKLQDFMAHYIIQKATEAGLPVQIHTGILARNANVLANSNPENLNNLFLDYPETRFILLHFAFPYIGQVFSLAKMFPNVYLDFCWVPMLSRSAAARALEEFFDLVPYHKLVWGGDAYRVEEAYAGACLAREVMASVLAGRVERGDLDEEMALTVARAILRDNAMELFGI